ncbi:2',3'-cyclic-nucleotide 2'-phosphodiesterase/3'-nucleotidase [Shimia isoporae]|uniref:2',3'-cyclic-nucleotide 2'-phosphodiesterase/3'-nucleotidase n=1 Tax=Shimia isoporae TaxID=647720 RepID=A0A4R1NIW9_9RHOB|nr:5'-nucleotidase C-terminal domain-containing protein [Shimia isoporae]TCL08064.1 2',3'-cyclic-nucleotide 2'-phosphodiesterase/3'-nucleotidase [Shimia isoporae]
MPGSPKVGPEVDKAHVRVLATTDVHAKLLAYDYFRNRPTDGASLAKLATLIEAQRLGADATLVVDNGDFLQGGPIAEMANSSRSGGIHPVIAAMNAIGYGAVGLGNHEFDLEEPSLRDALKAAEFPVLCSNLDARDTQGRYSDLWESRVLIPLTLGGGRGSINVGIFSVLPPQVVDWNASRLQGAVVGCDILQAARSQVAALLAEGADLVVALAHSGLSTAPYGPDMEKVASHVAALEGVDALIAGHVHECFPSAQSADSALEAELRKSVNGKPVVMPGAMAACLGQIDLYLTQAENASGRKKWCVEKHESVLLSGNGAAESPKIVGALKASQDEVLTELSRVVGELAHPVFSYFSMVKDDCMTRIVAEAKMSALRSVFAGTEFESLPLLASTTPSRCGGRAGAGNYVDLASGPLEARGIAELQPYDNFVSVLQITGSDLQDWLEMSASFYNQLEPRKPGQRLFERDVPSYKRETVFGVSYAIDLTQPARFDASGTRINPEAQRVTDLLWQGRDVAPDQRFLLATNDFRGGGGGNFPGVDPSKIVRIPRISVRDAIGRYLAQPFLGGDRAIPSWTFRRMKDVSAVFETGAGSRKHLDLITLPLEPGVESEDGFISFTLQLDHDHWPA